ncbi:hypothetical protein JCM11754A_05840 [Isoptericola variabilis]
MTMEATKSYRDYLEPGESLCRSVEDVCIQLEKEGWRVQTRTDRGLRYWCPSSRCGRHHLWIDLENLTDERLDFMLRRTCLTFN